MTYRLWQNLSLHQSTESVNGYFILEIDQKYRYRIRQEKVYNQLVKKFQHSKIQLQSEGLFHKP
jgi:hypothetical protein